jgi:hypothetical protein
MSETSTHTMQDDSKLPDIPECRDSAKRRSFKTCDETESSSADVEMLKKMDEVGHELDEKDSKYKEDMIALLEQNVSCSRSSGRQSMSSTWNKSMLIGKYQLSR